MDTNGLATLLTVLFVGLKLAGVISWAWWQVFLPIIVSVGLTVLIVGGGFLGLWTLHRKAKNAEPDYPDIDIPGKDE